MMNTNHDPLCPRGYRLLVQSKDHETEEDFRAWVSWVFGHRKGNDAKIVKGFCDHRDSKGHWGVGGTVQTWLDTGYRAYLPMAYYRAYLPMAY